MNFFDVFGARIVEWLSVGIPRVIAAVVIFLIMFYLAGWVGRAIARTAARRSLNAEVTLLLSRLGRGSVILLGFIWALQQVHFDLTAFLAGLGVVGFTVGFALQDISRNFVSGVLLLWQQPFNIGDMIEVSGFTGRITDISLRSTEMRTADGLLVLIPNADVYTKPIVNHSRVLRRRIELKAWAQYDNDLQEVSDVALAAIGQVPGLALADPVPSITFDRFVENAVNFTLYFWIDTRATEVAVAQDQSVKAIKAAFEAAGIELRRPRVLSGGEDLKSY